MNDTLARRDWLRAAVRTGAVVLAFVILLLCVTSLGLLLAGQARLADVAQQSKVTADQVADCTTPGGECYERGQHQTSVAVARIIGALNQLEEQRGHTSTALKAGQAQIRDALRQLCAAQHVSCPSAGVP